MITDNGFYRWRNGIIADFRKWALNVDDLEWSDDKKAGYRQAIREVIKGLEGVMIN